MTKGIDSGTEILLDRLRGCSFPTFGHFLEDGFLDYRIQPVFATPRVVGLARTVRVAGADACAVDAALATVRQGDVLVIDTGSNLTHAHIGLVTATRAQHAGAAAIVIDGLVTDVDELATLGLPVFARGATIRTTKRLDRAGHTWSEPVVCGGVAIADGHIVLADTNGVFVASSPVIKSVIAEVEESDRREPELLASMVR